MSGLVAAVVAVSRVDTDVAAVSLATRGLRETEPGREEGVDGWKWRWGCGRSRDLSTDASMLAGL